ncbi:Protein STRUBBELIG-RECEPTOR FAMILY 2 like [Actinidia chinensis var. chinensis]|uniref:Protein STRUBBELIG-RECEPTOR FAMILY 2 like n=1 Tax=Actinidia chinensis var. chinensis TaxID=1590841 RepID=A0A2R6Q4N1_ACTCC|nr:Protein STRUBBELIG-RECEPTOR FAMILY 2 like [Actinidia chinensis var. chinensis]
MAKWRLWLYHAAIAFLAILVLEASSYTDDLDVMALQDMYAALNNPPQLQGWKLSGGDPCEESWAGVACSGSSVIHIKLHGLQLTGKLGFRLSQLHSLKQLDVSSNNIQGEIPYGLPFNATNISSSCRNLSHNSLSGPIGNVFDGLLNLKEMDLSYNNFSGDLPSCFGSLMSLNRLFLEKNGFTGSVILLARLPLSDLNIQDNHFSGVLPNQFQYIRNLWLEGNSLKAAENDPPWNFPLEVPAEQNISSPPTTEANAMESYPSQKVGRHKKNRLGPGGVACLVGGVTLMAACTALVIVIRIHQSRAQKRLRVEISRECSQHSLPLRTSKDYFGAKESPRISGMGSPPVAAPRRIPPIHTRTDRMSRRSFSKKPKIPSSAKVYTMAELQSATNGFSEEHLLGEGSLGSVYKADFPNGQVMAVKNINTVTLSLHEEEQFLDVIWNAARLRHPNIVTLLGYCFERGQHLLVYECVRNLTLDDALHCEAYLPLSWGLRLKIALGVARALDYLHSTCSPPVAHSNLKAANILLDEELMPHLSDCGLAILRPLTSNSVKVKASEMAIGDTGYVAPECVQHGSDSIKGDIYAFGVLLLELLTGKKPFDGFRLREGQSLVKSASSRLHDNESWEKMADPSIKRSLSSRALSWFADIVSLCVQSSIPSFSFPPTNPKFQTNPKVLRWC